MLTLLTILIAFADRPDHILADFESPTYGVWVVTGEAFGPGPAKGALPGQMAVVDFQGTQLVNSFFKGDDTEGTLTSPDFTIDRKNIRFLVGGGRHPNETCIELIIDGKVERTTTGHDSEFLRPAAWDVAEFEGKTATIRIVDKRRGGWGHINVDHIVLCDVVPPTPTERETLLAKAEASVAKAAERAAKDPLRPTYHILPPANWINDPNGPIFHKGYYHMFYQHNPYGDGWGNMHWGHVRSKDLAHWERMPIAIWPSKEQGEDHVFSGSATVNAKGELMLFYTSIGQRNPEQWAAIPDGDDLVKWKKHPKNPLLTESLHGNVKVHEWRDPYVFKTGGKTYIVCGGNLNASKGGEGVVTVYRAEDESLTKWTYLGVLFKHPDADVKNVECPLFFPLGEKWVLIVSQGRPVQWFVGSLDPKTMKFTAETRGIADAGNFYAPNVTIDPKGRAVQWGWVPDFPKDRGWNGCLTLPRVMTLDAKNRLRFEPAVELAALRDQTKAEHVVVDLESGDRALTRMAGESIEIDAELRPSNAATGVRVRQSADRTRSLAITFDPKANVLDVGGTRLELADKSPEIHLRIFVDHSVTEVYASTGQVVTKVYMGEPGDSGVEAFATGRANPIDVKTWPVESAWVKK